MLDVFCIYILFGKHLKASILHSPPFFFAINILVSVLFIFFNGVDNSDANNLF